MSDARSHDRLEELIAVDALGGLDSADRDELLRTLAEHGDDCPECSALLADYGEAAAALALTLEPAPVGRQEEERLVARARLLPDEAEAAAAAAGRDLPRGVVPLEPGRRRGRWITSIAVAASLVVGVLAGFAVAPRAPAGTSALLTFVSQPQTRLAALPSVTGSGRGLTVAYRPGQTSAFIVGAGFTKPPGGRTYELWYHRTDAPPGLMSPAGLFVPIHGDVIAQVAVGTSFDLLAVSVEPPGGSDHPTTQPVYVSQPIS
jgi:hypothetical protein